MILLLVETISNIPNNKTKSVAYTDDLSSVGSISVLNVWWDNLMKLGPRFGYYIHLSKSWLIIKEKHLEQQGQCSIIQKLTSQLTEKDKSTGFELSF